MKKRFFSILLCAFAAACAMVEPFISDLNLTLSRESTVFAPDPVWTSGDAVKVLSSTRRSGKVFRLSAGAKQESGTFSGEKPGSAPFILTAPEALSVEYKTTSTFYATFPQVQRYVADGYDADACLYAATADGSVATRLRCPMAVLSLPLKSQLGITSLTLTTPDEYPLCGKALVRLGADAAVTFEGEGACSLVLDCGKGVTPGTSATVFRFVLPSAALSAGADLKISDAEGGAMYLSIAPIALANGDLLTLPETQYAQEAPPYLSTSVPGLYSITNKGMVTPVFACDALRDQIGLLESSDALEWRLQRLSEGKLLRVSLPKRRGTLFDAEFSSIGLSTSLKGMVQMRSVQSKDGLVWCLDATGNKLLIFNTAL